MNKRLNRNNRGFTLVELMITLAIASMVLAGIYQVYQSQLKSYVVQNAIRDTQEDLRSAFYYLERTIRMAGFDPNRGARATMPSQLGLLPDLSYFGNEHEDVRTSFADDDVNESKFKSIVFTLNANGEKRPPEGLADCEDSISRDCARKIDLKDSELIAFRLYKDSNGVGSIQKYQPEKRKWWTIAHNVQDLRFEFFGDDGPDTDQDPDLITNFATNDDGKDDGKPDFDKLALVRLVRITIKTTPLDKQTILSSKVENPYVISAMVRLRNSGLEI